MVKVKQEGTAVDVISCTNCGIQPAPLVGEQEGMVMADKSFPEQVYVTFDHCYCGNECCGECCGDEEPYMIVVKDAQNLSDDDEVGVYRLVRTVRVKTEVIFEDVEEDVMEMA